MENGFSKFRLSLRKRQIFRKRFEVNECFNIFYKMLLEFHDFSDNINGTALIMRFYEKGGFREKSHTKRTETLTVVSKSLRIKWFNFSRVWIFKRNFFNKAALNNIIYWVSAIYLPLLERSFHFWGRSDIELACSQRILRKPPITVETSLNINTILVRKTQSKYPIESYDDMWIDVEESIHSTSGTTLSLKSKKFVWEKRNNSNQQYKNQVL